MPSDAEDLDIAQAMVDRIGGLLSELEDADFERVDPPPEIWMRIEADITADARSAPKEPPERVTPPGDVVEYWIDADDMVAGVGRGWAAFARDNGAAEQADPAPNRSLWTYFNSDEVRELWQLVVQRTRATQTTARVPLRCDA
ncbi:MAG: hypothetical protein OES57_03815, partial [Acidimicrobiia bacterium]|nr:hypothetical protein [Acidimicrobiia bacterium]